MADVGCAGILVADTFCGPMARLPQPGELLALDHMVTSTGGCAANVAIDLSKQGIAVDVVGTIGTDSAAEIVLQGLQKHHIRCEQITRTAAHPTSSTIILLVHGEDRRYLHDFGANHVFTIKQIDRDWVKGLKVFYLGGLYAMPGIVLDELLDLLSFCRTRNVITIVDVVIPQHFTSRADLPRLLPLVDYFLPNDDEAQRMTGQLDPHEQIQTFKKMGSRTVIITCGTKGCLASDGTHLWKCGAFEMHAVDPSGSGDAFASGVITGILRDWKMPDILNYAAALGASATTAIGTTNGVFNAGQARDFLATHQLTVQTKQM
jgi:sugar/nucleoside kinase (ribokinase family)